MVAVAVQRSIPIACSPDQAAGRCVAVIVTRDRPALLAQCLAAVLGQSRRPDQVVVVDNASGPETRDVLGSADPAPSAECWELPVASKPASNSRFETAPIGSG